MGGLLPQLLRLHASRGLFSSELEGAESILTLDVAVDSHTNPSVVRVFLQRAKADPFGKGVSIYLAKTDSLVCPVFVVLHYLVIHSPGEGPLSVH